LIQLTSEETDIILNPLPARGHISEKILHGAANCHHSLILVAKTALLMRAGRHILLHLLLLLGINIVNGVGAIL
jgi:hypothetical protein